MPASFARASIVVLALLVAGCPEEEEKNLPVLSGTGAGSLPTTNASAGGNDEGGGTASMTTAQPTAGDQGSEGGTLTGTGGPDDTAGTFGTFGTFGTAGGPIETSIGEPPPVTSGPLTEGE